MGTGEDLEGFCKSVVWAGCGEGVGADCAAFGFFFLRGGEGGFLVGS